ncbi:uncharacterized protein Nmag_3140 [Natrialba magadii ATCC 43099]|uniref:Uncharacterized protein n=1 Tax=Natrialba magadii (strain ATCC 43099 / DSM 3394 / CCM 3739 / CIP 104546 / IAM 13178 / JCM 8861 / NBRC 102185 / NCIMB 2190 / MS3) TaxID=547559 RepID=D3SRR8_NATMM|nr:hypothetical protein [Natrialba magadii]ADD06692.1 uncharacterized protein Nmag_3140 [Natrialba magadii ATCC 43099]ELY31847.1 hypothetical protein C500_04698 [Natrialba magadii ATCC 43099]
MDRERTQRTETERHTDRGQAYTLEGFIGAMIVLMAVLFALQSVVITPTSGGLADRSVQSQVQQEAQDALIVSDQHDNLSALVRHWDEDESFAGASGSPAPDEEYQTFSQDDLENASVLGQVLNKRFADQGWNYNLEFHYTDGSEFDHKTAVYQGSPPSDAITTSYMVTLYEDQYVKPDEEEEIGEFEDPMIPRATSEGDPVYNVVEVRLVVW